MKPSKGEMDGVSYGFFKCDRCGEEILDMPQLKSLARKYRELRKAKDVTFSQWGNSLAVRIPKEIADDLGLADGKQGMLMKDRKGLRIIVD